MQESEIQGSAILAAPVPTTALSRSPLEGVRAAQIAKILRCPQCHGGLEVSEAACVCHSCDRGYPHHGRCLDFVASAHKNTEDAEFQQERMHHRSLRGKLYDLGQRVITSEYSPFDHRRAFLAEIAPGSIVVELGSGNRRLNENVINIDLFTFPNVDISADIENSPISSNSVDYVILDSVIEHVPNPQAVIDEIWRILKPGGRLFCINPFLFPYHGYPAHYCNFTRDGMRNLLKRFSSAVVEPHYGPTSAMINIFSEYVAITVAGQRRTPYLAVRAFMLLLIGWMRFLDRWIIRSSQSYRLAGMLCSIATK